MENIFEISIYSRFFELTKNQILTIFSKHIFRSDLEKIQIINNIKFTDLIDFVQILQKFHRFAKQNFLKSPKIT